MEAESSSQMGAFYNPIFANCVHAKTMFAHVSDRTKFFWANCSALALECDWNSKSSQNVENLGFFGKVDEFFSKKSLQIFENRWMFQNFPWNQMVSNGIIS